jgi:hypothetical protein
MTRMTATAPIPAVSKALSKTRMPLPLRRLVDDAGISSGATVSVMAPILSVLSSASRVWFPGLPTSGHRRAGGWLWRDRTCNGRPSMA